MTEKTVLLDATHAAMSARSAATRAIYPRATAKNRFAGVLAAGPRC